MKIVLKVLKWIGLSIGTLLLIIAIAGLTARLFGPAAHQPEGELVDIGGFKLHINSSGEKNNKPTLVIEGGSGISTEHYHWLNEGLKDSMRVVRYDRAGIGYSDASDTPRDPETIARELHTLLENAGEAPPYILAAHSLGGPYIRVFTELYPGEVVGMVLIDVTHTKRGELLGLPPKSSYQFKGMMLMYNTFGVLADLGIAALYDKPFRPMLFGEGLPDEVNNRTLDFMKNGKLARTAAKEFDLYYETLERAHQANDFGSMPIRVFSTTPTSKADYRKRGIDSEKRHAAEHQMLTELNELSSNSQLFLLDANHTTIYTKKENATIICEEILKLNKAISFP